ncbi:MAG TPA: hypothetical protein VH186_00550 [Chloroflexia bacterium]|nr:hypothetical protein [Chloroflexia bacterium]
MNNSIFYDSSLSDNERREKLYQGQLFVFSPTPATKAFIAFARELLEEAFAPYEPVQAQHHLPVEQFVAILAELKPRFIHHPRSKELLKAVLIERGCDPEQTYFDVPRMRSMASGDYLKAGIAFPFHPHRDTWFSAPHNQLNWWMPIYDVTSDNVMAFHPRYFRESIKNSSETYNYYEWNKKNRANAAQYIKKDTRVQPTPLEPVELDPQVRPVTAPGGIIVFSGAQLHSTVPNTSGYTRFSIDFRTVNYADVAAQRGAPNVDSACTGTALRDFLRVSDLAPLPEELVEPYDSGREVDGVLVYKPELALVS